MTTQARLFLASPSAAYALWFIAIAALLYVLKIAAAIVIPFVVALFIWYLINALARFFMSRRVPRLPSLLLSFTLLFAIAFFVYHLVHGNILDVIREAPRYQENFSRIIPQVAAFLHVDEAPELAQNFREMALQYIDIGKILRGFALLLTDMAAQTLVVLFYLGFLLYEQRFFDRKIRAMIEDQGKEDRVRAVLRTIDIKIQKYIGVKSFVSACDSFLTFAILSLIGVDFAGFWGVMAFFLHFIPYAGSFVAIMMPCLIALIQFSDPSMFALTLVCLATSHAFLGHILDPYLMGNNLNLSPIFIITNLAMWGMLWGIPGMFLAIPILAIVALALGQFERTRPLAILMSKTGVIDVRTRA